MDSCVRLTIGIPVNVVDLGLIYAHADYSRLLTEQD